MKGKNGPNMADDWQKMDQERAARIVAEVNPYLDPVPFSPATTAVRSQKLTFYPGRELVELTDLSTVPPARKYAIWRPGEVTVIDWTNRAIYEMNERTGLSLDENTVLDYVRFFFAHVRGRHGRFLLTESVDDIRWQAEPPLQGRRIVQEMLSPVQVTGRTEDGTFNLRGFMVFKDSLFSTAIHVRSDGLVSMSGEELKVEAMPVQPDALP